MQTKKKPAAEAATAVYEAIEDWTVMTYIDCGLPDKSKLEPIIRKAYAEHDRQQVEKDRLAGWARLWIKTAHHHNGCTHRDKQDECSCGRNQLLADYRRVYESEEPNDTED